MASELRVPELGESVVEATIAEWLKAEGDPVKTGEAVVRLETDKVDVEVSAEQDGVLARVLRKQGEDVRVGEVLGSIEAAGAQAAAPAQSQPAAVTLPPEGAHGDGEGDRVPAGKATADAGAAAAQAEGPAPAVASGPAAADEGRISPLARRVAEELRVDVTQVPVGPSGRVTREDVEAFATSQRAQPASAPARPPEPKPAAQPQQPPAAPAPAVSVSRAPAQPQAQTQAQPASVRP